MHSEECPPRGMRASSQSLVYDTMHFDCVQILGQAKDPAIIQAHLKKLFAGVHQVALTDSKDAITAAMSVESEHVQLAAAVPVSDQVEVWLQSLLSGMQATLQVCSHVYSCPVLHIAFPCTDHCELLHSSLCVPHNPLAACGDTALRDLEPHCKHDVNARLQGLLTSCMQHTDFKSMPSQIICLAGSIRFTQQAEQAIEAGQLKTLQVCQSTPGIFYSLSQPEHDT